jgi:hypothetical protein
MDTGKLSFQSMTALRFAVHLPYDALVSLAANAGDNGWTDVAQIATAALLCNPPLPKWGPTVIACALLAIEMPEMQKRRELVRELDAAGCPDAQRMVDWAGLVHEADAREERIREATEDVEPEQVKELIALSSNNFADSDEIQRIMDDHDALLDALRSHHDAGGRFPPELADAVAKAIGVQVCYV